MSGEPLFVDARGTMTHAALRARAARIAGALREAPPTVAVAMADGIACATALLAATLAGRTVVPVPTFFSAGQIAHLMRDSGAGLALCDEVGAKLLEGGSADRRPLDGLDSEPAGDAAAAAHRLVYTSGTTGRPKGVLLPQPAIDHVARALIAAAGATAADRHLGLLPLSMLLEQVVALDGALAAGASVRFASGAGAALAAGRPGAVIEAFAAWRPTLTVLVPAQLEALVDGAAAAGVAAPHGLRLIAVGGAAVPARLAARAWAAGWPVHEGYGLSECGSVVALNRPGRRVAGTVGEPLPGVGVTIEDGEIVVAGPTVMSGHLGRAPLAAPCWRTGDAGHFDAGGRLVVTGRIDDVLVTRHGRNVQPQWIEDELGAAAGVRRVAVTDDGHGRLVALVEPAGAPPDPAELDRLSRGLPAYARPVAFHLLPPGGFAAAGLLLPAGKLLRARVRAHAAGLATPPQPETAR